MKLANLTLCALALAFAACGSGDDTPPGNQVSAANAAPEELSEEDAYAQERLRLLKALAEDAAKQVPSLGEYEKLVQAKMGKNDGGAAFLAAAERYEKVGSPGDEKEWLRLLKFGAQNFRLSYERDPTSDDEQTALDETAGVATAMEELNKHDSLFISYPKPMVTKQYGHVLTFCMLAFGRVPILLARGYAAKAARELATFLDVLRKLDGGMNTLSSSRHLHLQLTITIIAKGDLAPLGAYKEVVTALEGHRAEPVAAFKSQWLGDAAAWVSRIRKAESPDDIWPHVKVDTFAHEWLEFLIAVAGMFPNHAPNPFDPEQFEQAKTAAGKIGERRLLEAFGAVARRALEDQVLWLLWDLFREDLKSPLLNRKSEAETMVARVPHLSAEWSETELSLRLDPNCAILAAAAMTSFDRPETLKLRPKS